MWTQAPGRWMRPLSVAKSLIRACRPFTPWARPPAGAGLRGDSPRWTPRFSRRTSRQHDPERIVGSPPDPPALRQDPGAAPAVDGAVDPAPAEQAPVGGIDDGIDVLNRDVALHQRDARQHVALRQVSKNIRVALRSAT